MTQKTKKLALEKLLEQSTLKPCDFWAGEAQEVQRQDWVFEGGLFKKLFKGYIFCFLGHLVGEKMFEQFARETNLKKKRSVRWR